MSASEAVNTRNAGSAADIRFWICNELARSLKVNPSTIDTAEQLQSFGLDSLAALELTGGLASWLNRDLPATLMWDYASIDAMAHGLADHDAPIKSPLPPGVIEFQGNGNQTPVFFFPGSSGHPVSFAALSEHLLSRPCYGLTVPGLDGKEKPFTSVEDIAATILKRIRQVQPSGPYELAGYSFGGLLAYEAAQQLVASGETVSIVAIYDTFTPAGRKPRPFWQRLAVHAYHLVSRSDRLQYVLYGLRRKNKIAPPEQAEPKPPSAGDVGPAAPDRIDVDPINSLAAASYNPRPYAGRVVVFRAAERRESNRFYKLDPTNGWGILTRENLEVIDLPGTHFTMMDRAQSAAAAELLRPFLSDEKLR